MLKLLLAAAVKNLVTTALLVLCLLLGVQVYCAKKAASSLRLSLQREVAAKAALTEGHAVSQRKLDLEVKALGGQLAQASLDVKKSGLRPVEHISSVHQIDGTTKTTFLPAPGGPPAGSAIASDCVPAGVWEDSDERFKLNLKTGILEQHQIFRADVVVFQGERRFAKTSIIEISPKTGMPINEGSVRQVETKLDYVDAPVAAVGPFHSIVVAAVNEKGAFGAGVQFARWKNLNVGAVGYWENHKLLPAVQLSYRLKVGFLNTNLSVGPYYAPITQRVGVGATLELTR